MNDHHLRIKLGEHEFEASGSEQSVKEQFEQFKELVADFCSSKPNLNDQRRIFNQPLDTSKHSPELSPELSKMFEYNEKRKIVCLKKRPSGGDANDEAVLLTLLGFKLILNQDDVQVTDLNQSLSRTGFSVGRLDRWTPSLFRNSYIIKGGKGKGGKYSLTVSGVEKAQGVMQTYLQTITG